MQTSPPDTASSAQPLTGGGGASSARSPLGVGPRARRIRLIGGLVLFVYVATHYLNHMLGLHSLALMEAGRDWFLAVWRFPPLEIILALSLVSHVALSLLKAAQSRTFKMTKWEWAQLALGLAIPFLLAGHVIGTRGLSLRDGLTDMYAWSMWALWPSNALLQGIAIFTVWAHGCIGLHFWLRLRTWYAPLAPWLLGLAVLWPVLAYAGFADAGQEIQRMIAANRDWVKDLLNTVGFGGSDSFNWVKSTTETAKIGAGVSIAIAAIWRTLSWYRAKRAQGVKVLYPDGTSIQVAPGVSVLEASRLAGVPHASVCGGRGRCSTCRVRITSGLDDAPAPDEGELKVLKRINASDGVRLACQLRPNKNIAVAPLLPPNATPKDARSRADHETGAEREIAIMFVDIRAFTKISEDKLPFDIVFLLNQYFRAMGEAIEQNGGQLDKFIGDGIMALFGIQAGPGAGCRQALAATAQMSTALDELNRTLANDLDAPLRIGVGVHVGPVIVGEMGYQNATSVTAIGDAVNVASRLEPMTKEYGAEAIVSQEVLTTAGVPVGSFPVTTVEVHGRDAPLDVVVLKTGSTIATALEAAGSEG
ncbi:MAG: adenylate/guanylate cyclase domain-containing protein [Alphaproteobacteria bacterium]|nr:adenylate/guanylate cyclase domain-containing protein [Alphaproteobacteria bacterium]